MRQGARKMRNKRFGQPLRFTRIPVSTGPPRSSGLALMSSYSATVLSPEPGGLQAQGRGPAITYFPPSATPHARAGRPVRGALQAGSSRGSIAAAVSWRFGHAAGSRAWCLAHGPVFDLRHMVTCGTCGMACGRMWHVACGTGMWHVAACDTSAACGMWHVAKHVATECGVWHVACGMWRVLQVMCGIRNNPKYPLALVSCDPRVLCLVTHMTRGIKSNPK